MQVTLKDVAEKAGFSITTVSRALSGYSDVSERTRQHILAIASELGYQPNQIARQLRGQRTYTIGIVPPTAHHTVDDDFFSVLIRGVGYAAAHHGYDLLISAQRPGSSELEVYHRLVGGNRVDGVILARTHVADPRIDYLRSINHPFVVSGRSAPGQPNDFPYIDADSRDGIRRLVAHFVGYGHRHIAIILPPQTLAYTEYRLDGYRDGLSAAGLEYQSDYVRYGDLTRQGGYAAATALLDAHPHLTAVIAANDLMAIGAMRAVNARGLHVGDGVAVGGFDDLPLAEFTAPPLTTVRQPIYEIGERLTDLLLKVIAHAQSPEGNPPESMLLTPQLVIRESSGRPRSV